MGPFSTATAAASVFDAQPLPEQYADMEVFTTDAVPQSATCSWFCTRLIEFSPTPLCKV